MGEYPAGGKRTYGGKTWNYIKSDKTLYEQATWHKPESVYEKSQGVKAENNQQKKQGESSHASNHDNKGGEVVVTGNEFGGYKDIKELRKKAVKYYSEHLQGTSVENPALGRIDMDENGIVNFTGSGKREFKNSSAKEHKLLLVRHLPKLIQETTRIDGKPSSEDKHDGEYFYYLHTDAKIDGKDTPVEITLVKWNDGSIQYYNHTLPTEEHKKDAVVSTGPESSNEALGTPSIPASSIDFTIPQNQKKSNQKSTRAKIPRSVSERGIPYRRSCLGQLFLFSCLHSVDGTYEGQD